jgi:hypothetical protein
MRNWRENLMQKVALMHNPVKNNECDVTSVLKEPRRRSMRHSQGMMFPIALSTSPSSAPHIGLVPPVPHVM